MTLWLSAVSALLLATVAALALCRREPAHRAVAAVLAWGLVEDLVVGHKGAFGLGDYLARHYPYAGGDVVLYHVGNALVTSWPAALVMGSWWVFGADKKTKGPEAEASEPSSAGGVPAPLSPARGESGLSSDRELLGPSRRVPTSPASRGPQSRDPEHAARRAAVKATAALWLLANVLLVAVVPREKDAVQRALLVVELAALVGGAAAVVARKGPWTAPRVAMLWLLGVELVVVVLGPFRGSVYQDWDKAQFAYACGFAVLAIGQVVARRRLSVDSSGDG